MLSKEGQAEKLVHNINDNIGVMNDELSLNVQAPVHEPTIIPHQVDHQQQTLAIDHKLDEFSLQETNLVSEKFPIHKKCQTEFIYFYSQYFFFYICTIFYK